MSEIDWPDKLIIDLPTDPQRFRNVHVLAPCYRAPVSASPVPSLAWHPPTWSRSLLTEQHHDSQAMVTPMAATKDRSLLQALSFLASPV